MTQFSPVQPDNSHFCFTQPLCFLGLVWVRSSPDDHEKWGALHPCPSARMGVASARRLRTRVPAGGIRWDALRARGATPLSLGDATGAECPLAKREWYYHTHLAERVMLKFPSLLLILRPELHQLPNLGFV